MLTIIAFILNMIIPFLYVLTIKQGIVTDYYNRKSIMGEQELFSSFIIKLVISSPIFRFFIFLILHIISVAIIINNDNILSLINNTNLLYIVSAFSSLVLLVIVAFKFLKNKIFYITICSIFLYCIINLLITI